MKKIPISIRVDEDLHQVVKDQAQRRRVTVSHVIHEILVKALIGKQGGAQ